MARNCVRRTKVIKAVKNKKMSQKRGIKLKKKKKKIEMKMLTNKNGLALFLKEIEKRVKEIGWFVEYAPSGCMEIAILMKPIFYLNDLV